MAFEHDPSILMSYHDLSIKHCDKIVVFNNYATDSQRENRYEDSHLEDERLQCTDRAWLEDIQPIQSQVTNFQRDCNFAKREGWK